MTAGAMVDDGEGVVAVAFGALLSHALARRATRVSAITHNLVTTRDLIATWRHLAEIRSKPWPRSHLAQLTVLQTIGAHEPIGHLTSTVAVSRGHQRIIDPTHIPCLGHRGLFVPKPSQCVIRLRHFAADLLAVVRCGPSVCGRRWPRRHSVSHPTATSDP